MHGVVSEFLSPLCEHELAFGRAPFGFDSQLQILLGVGIYAFSEEFRELCGVFCLFKGYSFVRFRDFRISLSVGLAAHCKVHSNFRAFAGEVCAQAFDNFRVESGGDSYFVFVSPGGGGSVVLDDELGFGSLALRAYVRKIVRIFEYITAYRAYYFFCHDFIPYFVCYCFWLD